MPAAVALTRLARAAIPRHSAIMPSFAWLTPPVPAAIAVLRLDVLPGPLRRWPGIGRTAFGYLRDRAGEVVDEVVVLRRSSTSADLCCHGGVGMRAVVEVCLSGLGYVREEPPTGDRWSRLAAAPSLAAARWLLTHGEDEQPAFPVVFLVRKPLVLITGPTNAGKSTLLNHLCGYDRALTSAQAGTTRDLVQVEAVIGGWRLDLVDSAGLRATDDALEAAGQDLVAGARRRADLVCFLAPMDQPGEARRAWPEDLVVHGKADLGCVPAGTVAWSARREPRAGVRVLGQAMLDRLGLPAA